MINLVGRLRDIKPDPNHSGKLQAKFVLSDDVESRLCQSGNLTNDDQGTAGAEVLARGQFLFDQGKLYEETHINIDSPEKDFIENLPTLQVALNAVDNISNLTDAKVFLDKVTKVIYALKERD